MPIHSPTALVPDARSIAVVPIHLLAEYPEILAALQDIMAGQPTVPLDRVMQGLRDAGLRLSGEAEDAEDQVLAALEDDACPYLFHDGDVVALAALLDGVTLTHRLSQAEVDRGVILIDDDIAGFALDHLLRSGLQRSDGTPLDAHNRVFDGGTLHFQLGEGEYRSLGVAAGDLIGLKFRSGVARLVPVGEPLGNVAPEVKLPAGQRVELDDVVDEWLRGMQLFREPTAPISELLAAQGRYLESGFIWASRDAYEAERSAKLQDEIATAFELDRDEAAAVAGLAWYAGALQQAALGAPAESVLSGAPLPLATVRSAMADPWVAFAMAEEVFEDVEPSDAGLLRLCDLLASGEARSLTRAERAGVEYLRARCLESVGDPLAAESHFARAVELDHEHAYAMLGLAGIACDRGSYEAAQILLDRAGADEEHPLRTAVEGPTAAAPPAVRPGRNEPCWCGSGRKYKACHARVSSSPLPDRAPGLLMRAIAWTLMHRLDEVKWLLEFAVRQSQQRAPAESFIDVLPDLVLFEGGAIEDYLTLRGPLIPADEAMLAQQWLLRPRSLFEVTEVRRGHGLTLRDIMTGDTIEVRERAATEQLKAGDLLLTRAASVGDHDQLFGGVTPIRFAERELVIELLSRDPSPSDIISFLARRFRLPEIVTPEGDRMRSVEGVFTARDASGLRAELDANLEASDDGSWLLLADQSGPRHSILGTVTLDGDTLTATAMSEQRYQRLLDVLAQFETELVEQSYTVESFAGSVPTGQATSLQDIAEHPEMDEHVAAMIADFERSWIDESIPALGGITPRQAAEDPTRRADLISLLDSFPAAGSPLEMDGSRLRAALGL